MPTDEDATPFGRRGNDVTVHLGQLPRRHNRAEIHVDVEGITDLQPLGQVHNALCELLPNALMDDQSGSSAAYLALVVEDPPHGRLGGCFQVWAVLKDDVGTLAPRLEGHNLEVGVGGVAKHLTADLRRAG